MSYVLKLFDGLLIPEEIQRGDSQDLGTGSALTSFLPLPGGGYYDNYQDRKSPQGIRPLSKLGLFWGTHSELRELLDDWRAKIGVRGRLTIEYDDGSLRWQWARLQDVSTPRPSNAKGGWLPFTFTWITAAQNWRGVVYGEEDWTWGDESWVFGDGSAEMGVGAQTFTLADADERITVTHNGNIDAPNVKLRFDMVGTWQDLTVVNETTGQQIIINRAASDVSTWVEIDAAGRKMWLGQNAPQPIVTATRQQNNINVLVTGALGFATGEVDTIRLEDAGVYTGTYYPTTESAGLLLAAMSPRNPAYGSLAIGTAQRLIDLYSVATISDRDRWLVLVSGDNTIHIELQPFPTSATVRVEFVDHYA